MSTIVDVPLRERSYQIIIETGALEHLGEHVRRVAPHARAMLVMDAAVADSWGAAAKASLSNAGYDVEAVQITAREDRKVVETVTLLHDAMIAAKLERRSPVVALGGGITGDIAGFAAATYLRGVPVVQVPTTLLAMVDAAIGGKTGVNMRLPGGALGKNMIGAFWQPGCVVVDPQTLSTLPPRERACGMAEGVKHAIIADAALFADTESQAAALVAGESSVTESFIARCAAIKARIVAADERESAARALLNFGHTFGHAIESLASDDLRHGEAVAIGMVAAAGCGEQLGRTEPGTAKRIADVLERLGLPTVLPGSMSAGSLSAAALIQAMGFDKKVEGGAVRIVLAARIGEAFIDACVPAGAIEAAWRAVGATK